MIVGVIEPSSQLVDCGDQDASAGQQIKIRIRDCKRLEITIDTLDRCANVRWNALGFLVVGQDARHQEANDENGAADAAGQKRIELEKLQPEIVHCGLGTSQKQHNDGDGEEQAEFLAEADVRSVEVKMADDPRCHLLSLFLSEYG